MSRRSSPDLTLVGTALFLILGGLLMVGSSSNYIAMDYGLSPSAFFLRQFIHVALGLCVMGAITRLPYARLNKRWVVFGSLAICIAALLVVLAMPSAGGARRWILIGPFRFQPSEFTKLFAVLFMAYMLSRKQDQVNDLGRVLIPCGAVLGSLAGLIYIERDLGSVLLMLGVSAVMIFVAGLKWKYIGAVTAMGTVLLIGGIVHEPYRLERLRGWTEIWMHPTADHLGTNFQLDQSLVAIGSGGLYGVGLGNGQQKAYYVPASHTDFIFSVIGEEWGLVGTGVLLVAFLVIFWRGLLAANRAPDLFGFYLALGLTCLIVLQALTNMAVCVGLFPTKGLPLPMISYGGSSLLSSMVALGLLLNVSQHSN